MAADLTTAALAPEDDVAIAVLAAPTPLAAFWSAYRENKGALFGLSIVAIVLATAALANFLAPHSPIEQFRASVDPGFTSCEQAVDEHGQMTRHGFHGRLI